MTEGLEGEIGHDGAHRNRGHPKSGRSASGATPECGQAHGGARPQAGVIGRPGEASHPGIEGRRRRSRDGRVQGCVHAFSVREPADLPSRRRDGFLVIQQADPMGWRARDRIELGRDRHRGDASPATCASSRPRADPARAESRQHGPVAENRQVHRKHRICGNRNLRHRFVISWSPPSNILRHCSPKKGTKHERYPRTRRSSVTQIGTVVATNPRSSAARAGSSSPASCWRSPAF